MFIYSNRNVILRSQDGAQSHPVRRGFVGEIPDWAGDTDYFRALVKDGKISLPASHRDKDVQAAEEKPARVRRGKKVSEEA